MCIRKKLMMWWITMCITRRMLNCDWRWIKLPRTEKFSFSRLYFACSIDLRLHWTETIWFCLGRWEREIALWCTDDGWQWKTTRRFDCVRDVGDDDGEYVGLIRGVWTEENKRKINHWEEKKPSNLLFDVINNGNTSVVSPILLASSWLKEMKNICTEQQSNLPLKNKCELFWYSKWRKEKFIEKTKIFLYILMFIDLAGK